MVRAARRTTGSDRIVLEPAPEPVETDPMEPGKSLLAHILENEGISTLLETLEEEWIQLASHERNLVLLLFDLPDDSKEFVSDDLGRGFAELRLDAEDGIEPSIDALDAPHDNHVQEDQESSEAKYQMRDRFHGDPHFRLIL